MHRRNRTVAPPLRIDKFALIIGAMKSGTTSLFEHLGRHPTVAPCTVKEPKFFSDEAFWSRGPEAYEALWDWDPTRHHWALEASTAYSMLKPGQRVTDRMASLGGRQFRFIYLMRHPVDRIASQLSHVAIKSGPASVDEDAFRWAIQVSRYATQLDAYLEHWPRESLLPLLFEDMLDNPEETVARTQAFLGLKRTPLDPSTLEQAHNNRLDLAAGVALTRAAERFPFLETLRPWAPETLVRLVRTVIGRINVKAVDLSERQREQAAEELRPEVRRLHNEWGLDTSRWEPLA